MGTTVKDSALLPQDLLADEYQIYMQGKRAYVAKTIGQNCFLGMAACAHADAMHLEQGY